MTWSKVNLIFPQECLAKCYTGISVHLTWSPAQLDLSCSMFISLLQWLSTALELVCPRLLWRLDDRTLFDLGVADEGRGVDEVNSDNLSTVFDDDIS